MGWESEQKERIRLHRKLGEMYRARGFKRILTISSRSYTDRLHKAIAVSDKLVADHHCFNRHR